MPSIQDAVTTDLSGYVAIQRPPIMSAIPNLQRANPALRCPLPPFNIDPDTLRQFENGSQSPKIRVLPLPVQSTAENPVTTTTTISTSSSSSSSSTSTATLLPKSVNFATSILPFGSFFSGTVQMSESFQLIALSASAPCEVRLYGSALAQSHDALRVNDSPVPPEITSNIIACVSFDTLPYQWPFQNIIGANQDTPQSATVYVTVFNNDPSMSESITVSLVFVPLET